MSGGMNFTIRIENNSKIVLDGLKDATERALYAIGVKGVEGSVDAISGKFGIEKAVDTGRLRASISFITPTEKGDSGLMKPANAKERDKLSGNADKNMVVIGTNVEYAEKVHNGMWTSEKGGKRKYKERPFLRVGIDKTKDQMQEQVTKILKGQL